MPTWRSRAPRPPGPGSCRAPSRTGGPGRLPPSTDPRRSRRRGYDSARVVQKISSCQPQSVFPDCHYQLPHLVSFGLSVRRLEIEHHWQLSIHENVVTAALPSQIVAERVGKAEQVVEPDFKVAGSILAQVLRGFMRPHANFETATSFEVMNSSRAGVPLLVAAMPRLIAGTI